MFKWLKRRRTQCRCGATTAAEHERFVLAGGRVHTYGGPR